MLKKKNHIIIGLTTFNTELLRISIPALARLKSDIYLIINNNNPDVHIANRQIRRLGYRGKMHIINTGTSNPKINILHEIDKRRIKSNWMLFIDDSGILTNIDIPPVSDSNYAVMQNTIVIKRRITDLLRVIDNPNNYVIDDINVAVEKPHIGLTGTLLRTGLATAVGKLDDIESDEMLWTALGTYAKTLNPLASAIYMDSVNYIAISDDLL